MSLNWLGLIVVVVGIYLVFKVAGALFKLALWLVILVGAYWFAAPLVGLPGVAQLLQALPG